MKKLIISAVALTLTTVASADAANWATTHRIEVVGLQEKVAVKPEQLPKAIQDVIQGDDFKGWEVVSAFLITAQDKTQYYELNVKRGTENARVKLDKDGKNVD
jgi:hypothetical protein